MLRYLVFLVFSLVATPGTAEVIERCDGCTNAQSYASALLAYPGYTDYVHVLDVVAPRIKSFRVVLGDSDLVAEPSTTPYAVAQGFDKGMQIRRDFFAPRKPARGEVVPLLYQGTRGYTITRVAAGARGDEQGQDMAQWKDRLNSLAKQTLAATVDDLQLGGSDYLAIEVAIPESADAEMAFAGMSHLFGVPIIRVGTHAKTVSGSNWSCQSTRASERQISIICRQ